MKPVAIETGFLIYLHYLLRQEGTGEEHLFDIIAKGVGAYSGKYSIP